MVALYAFIEKTRQDLNALSPSEWVLIDVIADCGAGETEMLNRFVPERRAQ